MDKFEEVKNMKLPDLPKKKIIRWIVIIAVAVFILTGLYTVNPEEVGVIQRFGKYIKTTDPGLHFKIPFGVDKLTKVPIKEVKKEEFGFRTIQAGVKSKFSSRDYSNESLMLTGDTNIADVEWIVQYRIKDPYNYLFIIRNIRNTIRSVSEYVVRQIVGDRSVDEVIILDRKDIAFQSENMMQKVLDEYHAGIEIVTIKLQNVNPPDKVKPAFNAVNSAKQEKERITNDAWQKYNQVIPEAKGKAKRTIEEAEGYAVNRVNRAQGDAKKFIEVWNKYRTAKTVTKKRMYLETLQEILPKVEKIYLVDEDQKGILPLLDLGRGK
jgi:membrane protease subunit HflK